MPVTSNILPNREDDSEVVEREIMMPHAEVVDGVVGEEWFVDIYLGSSNNRPLVSIPTDSEASAYEFIGDVTRAGFISVDHDVYLLHRISHFHVRTEAITIRSQES